jgi:hypothetical protein
MQQVPVMRVAAVQELPVEEQPAEERDEDDGGAIETPVRGRTPGLGQQGRRTMSSPTLVPDA